MPLQFTLERLGRAETTEYDTELETLLEQTDKIKTSTERILNSVELILQPNPGIVCCYHNNEHHIQEPMKLL